MIMFFKVHCLFVVMVNFVLDKNHGLAIRHCNTIQNWDRCPNAKIANIVQKYLNTSFFSYKTKIILLFINNNNKIHFIDAFKHFHFLQRKTM